MATPSKVRREAAISGLFFRLLRIKKTSKVGFISGKGFSGKERRGTKVVSRFFFFIAGSKGEEVLV